MSSNKIHDFHSGKFPLQINQFGKYMNSGFINPKIKKICSEKDILE